MLLLIMLNLMTPKTNSLPHPLSRILYFYPSLPNSNPVAYFPGDSEVILSLAAGSDDQVSLIQGLHHLLCLVETDVMKVGVGDHTLDICWRDRKKNRIKNRDVEVNTGGCTEGKKAQRCKEF